MGNVILVGLLIFATIMTAVGYKRGLMKSVFTLLSVVLILVIVTVLTPTARTLIRMTPIYSTIYEETQKFVYKSIDIDETEENPIAGLGVGEQHGLIEKLPLPQNLKENLVNNNTENGYNELEVENFADYLVTSITNTIVNAIAFIVLLIVVIIAVNTAIALLDIVSKLPVLNFFNKSGGALFGFMQALLIIWMACIIITAFGATEWGQKVLAEINSNVILSLIYSNNILEKIIIGLFG